MKTVLDKTLKNFLTRNKYKAGKQKNAKTLITLMEFQERLNKEIVELQKVVLDEPTFNRIYFNDMDQGLKRVSETDGFYMHDTLSLVNKVEE